MKATQKRKPNIAVLLLASLAAVLLILSLFARFGSGSVIPGGFLRVASGSMAPELNEGDLIFVWKTPYEELKVGDTVTVNDGQGLVTHKIVKTSDGCIVTRGVANDLNDLPSEEGNYVAKMIFSLPGLGWTAEALASPVVLLASIAVILFVFFAPLAVRVAYGEKSHGLALRGAAAALSCAIVLIPAADTSARYKGELSGGGIVVANEVNFTSNYLFDGGNEFGLNGWLGDDYKFEVDIFNFSNALKFNLKDVPLVYELELEKLEGDGYFTDYQVEIGQSYIDRDDNFAGEWIDHPDQVIHSGDPYIKRYGTGTLGDEHFYIPGGQQRTYHHTVRIYKVSSSIPQDASIAFRITARTAKKMTYDQTLTAVFELTKARAGEFIESESTVQSTSSEIIRHTVRSADILGSAQRRVIYFWNTQDIYVNSYQTDIWNIVQTDIGDIDTTTGLLDMTFQSNASLTLEFFKHDRTLSVAPYRETVVVNYVTRDDQDVITGRTPITVERIFLYTNPFVQNGTTITYTVRERAGALASHDQSVPPPVMQEYEVLPRDVKIVWKTSELTLPVTPAGGTLSSQSIDIYGNGPEACTVLTLHHTQADGDVDIPVTLTQMSTSANKFTAKRTLEPVYDTIHPGTVVSYVETITITRAS